MGVGQLVNLSSIWFLAKRELRSRVKTPEIENSEVSERVEGSKLV